MPLEEVEGKYLLAIGIRHLEQIVGRYGNEFSAKGLGTAFQRADKRETV